MAEEYINGIVRDIKSMGVMGISNVTLRMETALALIAELETVRAERDAALGAVADAMTTFRNIVRSIGDLEKSYAQGWLNRHENALNTQPQAEWTPRLGERVRVKPLKGVVGVVRYIEAEDGLVQQYEVETMNEGSDWYYLTDLTPDDSD